MNWWGDIGHTPGHADLDQLNRKFRPTCHRNTRDCTDIWICHNCRAHCYPIPNLLIDLPALQCSLCLEKNPSTFAWSMSSIRINGICPDPMIYNQGPTKYCSLYAVTGAVDFARRILGAFHLIHNTAPFTLVDMPSRYLRCNGVHLGEEIVRREVLFEQFDNIPLVLRTFRAYGIGYFLDTMFDQHRKGEVPRLYISSFFKVDATDVFLVTRLMASGYPLITIIRCGSLFQFANEKDVYSTPPGTYEDPPPTHSIIIHGSGTGPNPNKNGKADTFYVARNSHGEAAHSDYQKQRFGGDLCVWASDCVANGSNTYTGSDESSSTSWNACSPWASSAAYFTVLEAHVLCWSRLFLLMSCNGIFAPFVMLSFTFL